MMPIRLADPTGRDAVIWLKALVPSRKKQYRDLEGTPAHSFRRWKGRTNPADLLLRFPDPDQLSKALIHEDPESDLEFSGRASGPCDLVYLDHDGNPTHFPVYQDGQTGEPWQPPCMNLTGKPVWSHRYFTREDLIRRVAFSKAFLLVHSNALEYDFLQQLARHLEDRNQMVQVGSGRQGKGPLYLRKGGKAYRGFLDGRTNADAIRLILYLTHQKLEEP